MNSHRQNAQSFYSEAGSPLEAKVLLDSVLIEFTIGEESREKKDVDFRDVIAVSSNAIAKEYRTWGCVNRQKKEDSESLGTNIDMDESFEGTLDRYGRSAYSVKYERETVDFLRTKSFYLQYKRNPLLRNVTVVKHPLNQELVPMLRTLVSAEVGCYVSRTPFTDRSTNTECLFMPEGKCTVVYKWDGVNLKKYGLSKHTAEKAFFYLTDTWLLREWEYCPLDALKKLLGK